MKRTPFARAAGHTILELILASSATVAVLGAAIPAIHSILKAGDEGRTRTQVEADNRAALLKIGRELQNTSLTLTNGAGVSVFAIGAGTTSRYLTSIDAPSDLVEDRVAAADDAEGPVADGYGGPGSGCKKGYSRCRTCRNGEDRNHACGKKDGKFAKVSAMEDTPINPDNAGSGRRGETIVGRTRSVSAAGATILGDGAARPRRVAFTTNSVLAFQKVSGYAIVGGAPELVWSPTVTYRMGTAAGEERELHRVMNGNVQVISRNVSNFTAVQTDAGTVCITIMSQRRAAATGDVTYQANQIEIRPKN